MHDLICNDGMADIDPETCPVVLFVFEASGKDVGWGVGINLESGWILWNSLWLGNGDGDGVGNGKGEGDGVSDTVEGLITECSGSASTIPACDD